MHSSATASTSGTSTQRPEPKAARSCPRRGSTTFGVCVCTASSSACREATDRITTTGAQVALFYARLDAVHVAIAALNGMDYLLTWNCRHLANAAIRGKIENACRQAGMQPPIICTPEELVEA